MTSSHPLVKQVITFFNYRKFLTTCAFIPLFANATIADENFNQCKVNLAERAKTAGFSSYITETVINNISPIERVIALDKKQPEFTQTFEQYIKARVSTYHERVGKQKLVENKVLFDKLEQKYTGKYIKKHGYENVRGGKYTNSKTLKSDYGGSDYEDDFDY